LKNKNNNYDVKELIPYYADFKFKKMQLT